MCVNFQTVTPRQLTENFHVPTSDEISWKSEIWQDYAAPIIVGSPEGRKMTLGSYGIIPKLRIPVGIKRYSTMNARAETIASLKSFAQPWRDGQLCLVPMQSFFEPCYESGKAERYRISMHDHAPFAVAGLFRHWLDENQHVSYSFTQITINADRHPLMNRFHKPGEEKRNLVIIRKDQYDEWLNCKNPHLAKEWLVEFPAEFMSTERAIKEEIRQVNQELF